MEGRKVLDVGGGPVSLLLKCTNVVGTVVDPCSYPSWVYARYKVAGITLVKMKAEEMELYRYDLVLMYNVLQHVKEPKKVIENILNAGKEIRIFEWIDAGISDGHLHNLTEENLDRWLGGEGKVQFVDEHTAVGKAYFGIFVGRGQDG